MNAEWCEEDEVEEVVVHLGAALPEKPHTKQLSSQKKKLNDVVQKWHTYDKDGHQARLCCVYMPSLVEPCSHLMAETLVKAIETVKGVVLVIWSSPAVVRYQSTLSAYPG